MRISLNRRNSITPGASPEIQNERSFAHVHVFCKPVPGAKAGEVVDFGGLFGSTPVVEVRNTGASEAFVHFGGRIPAPIQSLRN